MKRILLIDHNRIVNENYSYKALEDFLSWIGREYPIISMYRAEYYTKGSLTSLIYELALKLPEEDLEINDYLRLFSQIQDTFEDLLLREDEMLHLVSYTHKVEERVLFLNYQITRE